MNTVRNTMRYLKKTLRERKINYADSLHLGDHPVTCNMQEGQVCTVEQESIRYNVKYGVKNER